MRSWLRAARLMLAIGWETGPGVFLSFVGYSIVSSVGPMLFAFGLKPLVDGIYYHNSADAAAGGIACTVSLVMLITAPAAGRWVTPRIRERSIMVMQRRLLTLTTTAPGLDHFERPDFWNRLQMLKRNFGDLLMGMANALVGPIVMIQLLISALVLIRIEPLLLILPVLGVPAAWLNQKAESLRLAGEQRAAVWRRGAQHLFALASSAQSAKETRIYGLRDELTSRHRDISGSIRQISESALAKSCAISLSGWLLFGCGYAAAALAALRAAASGHLSPGDIALTLTLATSLIAAAGRLAQTAGFLTRAVVAAGHYFWLADQVLPAAGPGSLPAARPAVPSRIRSGYELDHVSFAYPGTDRLALADVSLRLAAGTVVAVVGENGAGKTTLVKLLCRMYTPDRGRILLDGTDIQRFGIEEYRRQLSAGFQDFARFELLARETVGVGDLPKMSDATAVRGALAQAHARFADDLPQGLETQLGRSWDGGTDLSGGEWQKLALARAMMRGDAFLTVFDEPTAALDPQTEHALFEDIAASARAGSAPGRITVLISHRFSTVRMADVIVVLRQGRIVEQGSHQDLMANEGLYAELYGLQARAYR